jgi:anti-sigma factor RsiW
MKCEEISNELIAFVENRASAGARRSIEKHLAGCAACRTRAEEFRKLSSVLDEVPAIEPSFGFDARLRQRIAAEPQRPRFFSFVPQPRLALSMALMAALTVFIVRLPKGNPVVQPATAAVQQEDFNAIKNLGVLENYDVVTKLGALSELVPDQAPAQSSGSQPQGQPNSNDDGGA